MAGVLPLLDPDMNLLYGVLLQTALVVLHVAAASANGVDKFTLVDDGDRQLLSIAFSPSGQFMAVSSANHSIKIWDLNSLQRIKSIEDETILATCMAFSVDGQTLCLGTRDGTIAVLDVPNAKLILKQNFSDLTWHSIYPRPNGRWFAAGTTGKSVFLWDSERVKERKEFVGHEFDIQDVGFSPDGQSMVSGDFSGFIRVWEWNSDLCKASAAPVAGAISKMAVSPRDDLVLMGDYSCDLSICTLPKLRSTRLSSYGDEVESISHLAISSDGKYAAVGITDIGEIELWDLQGRKIAAVLSSRDLTELRAIAFTANGQSLATVTVAGVKLWKIQEIIPSEGNR
jgi:WD40 repeat protein